MSEVKGKVIAYRCPFCGKGVISNEGALSLTAERIYLRCPCKCSEMTLEFSDDGKFSATVPCIFCPTPHTYSLSKELIKSRDLVTLSCPYTGSANVFAGEINHVKAELSRTELELLDAMNENGIEGFENLQKKEHFFDSESVSEIIYVVKELDEEGRIFCNCPSQSGEYDIDVKDGEVVVKCTVCGAEASIPADSYLASHAFLESDELKLK